MSNIEHIAETLAVDFTAAVKAANKAKQAKIDSISAALDESEAERTLGLAEVRRLQEDAAKIAAESLRMAERVESTYRESIRMIHAELAELRGPSAVTGRGKVRAISGGRQLEN